MKKFLIALAAFACVFIPFTLQTGAEELTPTFECSDGSTGESILDNENSTMEHFEGGTTITLSSETPIKYVYVKWDKPPGTWKLTAGEKDITCGQNDFLHELVTLDSTADEVTITIPSDGATLVDLYIYSDAALPDDVQEWLPPAEGDTDILLISTHADDEVLFFGGIIPTYTNQEDVVVQVAYFTEHWSTGEDLRMQEALDGLWTMGVRYYPQFGEFEDLYSESLEEALTQYDYDEGLEYIVRTIRRFKPQVLIGQDIDGEYGHGCHRLTAKLIEDAIEITDDSSECPESAEKYGTWKVPKTYLHLYPENEIEMEVHTPLENLGGKTAYEIAQDAYLCHASQQWCWFYVSDGTDGGEGAPYSITKFGLLDTQVGADTVTNDIMDNITPYKLQASPTVETDENGETVSEAETDENGETIEGESAGTEGETTTENNASGKGPSAIVIIIIIVVVIVLVIVILAVVSKNKKKKEMERRRRAMARKRAMMAQQGQRPSNPRVKKMSGNEQQRGTKNRR